MSKVSAPMGQRAAGAGKSGGAKMAAGRAFARTAFAMPRARRAVIYAALFLALMLADALCARAAMPITITRDAGGLTIRAGGVTHRFATHAGLLAVTIPPRDPTVHEYQLDGTDATNNYTLDPSYLATISGSPYYRFIAWMRGLDDLSRWRDLCAAADGAPARCAAAPPIAAGASLPVPNGARQQVTVALQQPEIPVTLDLDLTDGSSVALVIAPNDHFITITPYDATGQAGAEARSFYPNDPGDLWPLAAQTLDFLIRTLLWALALLCVVWGIEAAVGWGLITWGKRPHPLTPSSPSGDPKSQCGPPTRRGGTTQVHLVGGNLPRLSKQPSPIPSPLRGTGSPRASGAGPKAGWGRATWARLTTAIHPTGLALTAAAFAFTVWIALVQYHAQPHIYDASAYLFQARVYASGRLYAPAPAAPGQFPGPFMTIAGDRWFSQYEPGTSATLAVGVALGVPWLVEPLLGALALIGMGLTLRRLYDRRVATLAVALGALSPFYLWLSASYLSHTIALCYLIWGLWALTRFAQEGIARGAWNLPLAAALWALALLSRDIAALFIAVSVAGLAWVAWRERWPVFQRQTWARPMTWAAPLAWAAVAVAAYLTVYLDYNAILTSKPLLTPRALMYPFDHLGIGVGVGFYGQHTLAAGFITVQALLSELAITLFGWPIYLTLAFIPLPFLVRRARPADTFLLSAALLMTFAFLGFYYHGIYLGPRYLFEALPFFLGMTARGIITLFDVGEKARGERPHPLPLSYEERGASERGCTPPLAAPALLLALLACAALYYFPRQLALHANFTGLGSGAHIQTAALSHPPVHHAIVITNDHQLYGYTLFGLNDPLLRGDVLYAYAPAASDIAALRAAYPDRALYTLAFDAHGQPHYLPLNG